MAEFTRHGDELIISLRGEIDHCAVQLLRKRIESAIFSYTTKTLIFDFSRVDFMDSSGVGMLIGRYKTVTERGGRVIARNMPKAVEQVFRMAGLHRIIEIERTGEETDDA